MKHFITRIGILTFTLSSLCLADGATTAIQNEYNKEQSQFESQMNAAKKKLHEVESARDRAIEASKTQAATDREGVAAMKKYWTLVLNRYAGDDGKFQTWQPATAKDVENVNNLFTTYLKMTALKGRVSAGMADRTLDWGMNRLEELAKQHGSPKPENNSELEILTHQIAESETSIKSIGTHADRLGIKLRDTASSEKEPFGSSDAAEGTTNYSPANDRVNGDE